MASKVFLSSALGGGIGALVALQASPPFWWLGLIVGGLVGYFSYEFKEVLQAARGAWIWILVVSPRGRAALREFGLWATIVLPSWVSITLPLFLLIGFGFGARGPSLWFVTSICLFNVWASLVGLMLLDQITGGTFLGRAKAEKAKYNVFAVWVAVCYYFLCGLWWLAKRVPRAMYLMSRGIVPAGGVIGRFLRHFFLLIHSEARLLCAFDAAMGALIGYSYENVLVGALSGGVIGLLNFEIVSKRVLHLVPSHR